MSSSSSSSYAAESRKHDPIDRGNKTFNYAGTATFVGGRLLDPFVQYAVLRHDWGRPLIHLLGGSTLAHGPPLITHTPLDRLALSPYRSIVLAMCVGGVLKQTYHILAICQERVSPALGLQVGLGNLAMDAASSLLFVCAQTSASANGQSFPQTPLLVGAALYLAGLLVELASEQQRHAFKTRPAHKGKLYTGGLFALVRHVNLFGFTLWRTGYALATGGWAWGAACAALSVVQLSKVAIPAHQRYLEEKYGDQFEQYKKATPYKLIPWLV